MIIVPMAVIAAYGLVSFWSSRRIYRQAKIKAFETVSGRRNFARKPGKYTFWSLVAGIIWPVWYILGFAILAVAGIVWIVTHGQEIPAERQQKIEDLEKEIFGEDSEPEDAKPVDIDHSPTPTPVLKSVNKHGTFHVKHTGAATAIGPGSYANTGIDCGCHECEKLSVKQTAKAGKGSTVIQVASNRGQNYYSSTSYWEREK
jgi:hypothetical protein